MSIFFASLINSATLMIHIGGVSHEEDDDVIVLSLRSCLRTHLPFLLKLCHFWVFGCFILLLFIVVLFFLVLQIGISQPY